jgi:hypothetical protein
MAMQTSSSLHCILTSHLSAHSPTFYRQCQAFDGGNIIAVANRGQSKITLGGRHKLPKGRKGGDHSFYNTERKVNGGEVAGP